MENINNAFIEHCGITFTEGDPFPVGHIKIEECHKNPYGYIHGGVIFTLADTVGGIAIFKLGKTSVTLNSEMHYIKNIKEGSIYAVPEIISDGHRITVLKVSVYADNGSKLAESIMTYYNVEEKNRIV